MVREILKSSLLHRKKYDKSYKEEYMEKVIKPSKQEVERLLKILKRHELVLKEG